MMICIGVTDAGTDVVVSDFRLARAHISRYLHEKLSFWQQLPWKLAALGDWVPEKAIEAAKTIIQEFDASPQDADLHRKLTWHYLKQGSAVRGELD
eukprot:12241829-Heterocapsa_arctica.AAC.1